ncbi:MAG: hypothetical protein OEV95_06875 [Gemmatimonadota bacterium]|nr:hypothetical protein [Gemmatimonadota bacterium]
MTVLTLRLFLGIAAAGAPIVGWRLSRMPVVAVAPPPAPHSEASSDGPASGRDRDLMRYARHATPFRIGHAAPQRRFGEVPQPAGSPPPSPPPKPSLVLTGLVTSPDTAVVVEGVPGHDGPVVIRLGVSVAGVRLHRLTAGGAVLSGFDTTWTLMLREPWK